MRILVVLILFWTLGHANVLQGAEIPTAIPIQFPLPIEYYQDSHHTSIWPILIHRIKTVPFNLVATGIFFAAIVHTLLAGKFTHLAQKAKTGFSATLFHLLGEVEAIFGIWLIPLIASIYFCYDWKQVLFYLNYNVSYIEPLFVVVIMAIAATRPIIYLAELILGWFASFGNKTPSAWWFAILTMGPMLGSFITEPAAMTISAMLLGRHFYAFYPSKKLQYATLGLLFVNISVGGTLTHFAAPPVLMVASRWGWNMAYLFSHFGGKAIVGILLSNVIYFIFFRREFARLRPTENKTILSPKKPIPIWILCCHVFFLIWTVVHLHHLPLFVGGFFLFMAFTTATTPHQEKIDLKKPLLVGLFLAALVTHGGLQKWWIQPVLGTLTELPLFFGSIVLTAFNDNAAITFLASLVPSFAEQPLLQQAVVSGAVIGGGLTVIANAPNPTGQALLQSFFKEGISPLNLFLGAILPTILLALCFLLM